MTLTELVERMAGWLASEYTAVLFELDGNGIGYALYRRDSRSIYLRQLFVEPTYRRHGIGRSALNWLREHAWADAENIRIDVLAGNTEAIAFWRAVGFEDYCITMEMER